MSSAHRGLDVRIFHKECCSLASHSFQVSLVINCDNNDVSFGESRKVRIIRLPPTKGRVKRFLLQGYRCYKEALGTKSDIYHFHDTELIPFGFLLRLRGKKVIYDVHEDLPRAILQKDWLPSFARKIISRVTEVVENFGAKYFFEIITSTPFILERFLRYNQRSININNFPLNSEIPEVLEKTAVPTNFCYIGGLTKNRGIEEVLGAMEIVPGGLKLHLAGTFTEDKWWDKVTSLDGWQKVLWHGYVGRESIKEILSNSIAGLVTLHPTPSYVDSLPVKLFEYMAFGIPVIASDFPLWRQIVDKHKCGILVNPLSQIEIAEAMKFCSDNRARAIDMGNNGRKAVLEEYNWLQEEKKLVEWYTELFI